MRGGLKATRLTNDNVRTLPVIGSDTIYADGDNRSGVPGLYVRIRAGGSRTFIIQWRQGRFQRRSTIGKVGVMTLDEARKKARKILVGIDEGQDPIAIKAKSRADSSQIFFTVAEEYLEHRRKDMKPLSLDQCQRHLRLYWKPLHKLAVKKVDRPTLAAELRIIAKERGAVAADRARSTLSAFFGWCVGEGYRDDNPVVGTNKHSKSKGRERVLSDEELVWIWNAAPDNDYGRIVKLLMLTAQRRDEIANLSRSELMLADKIEDSLIDLPRERTKNSRPHLVPLSAPAVEILAHVPIRDGREFLFGDGAGGFSGFSRAKQALDVRIAALLPAGQKMKAWTLHDLRRTADTKMGDDLGILPHVTEAILNHVSSQKSGKAGVAGTYNKATYLKEKRIALDSWGNHLMNLLALAEGANVVQFPRLA